MYHDYADSHGEFRGGVPGVRSWRPAPTRPAQDYRGDELVPIGIAARILGVSIDTVRRWDAAGHIRARRTPGGQRRFVVSELRALVDAA